MSRPTLRIREAGDGDAGAIVRIRNLNAPLEPLSVEEWRQRERRFFAPHLFRRTLLAEVEGVPRTIAFGSLGHGEFNFHPRKYYVHVEVDPGHGQQGIGTALFEELFGLARSREAVALWAQVVAESPASVRFFQRHGFHERRRFRRSRLDLAHANLAALPDRGAALATEGVRFTTLAEAGPERPDVRERLYELFRRTEGDVPQLGESTGLTFEQFVRIELEGPGAFFEGKFLAEADGRFVGVTTLERSESRPDEVHVGFTGTLREYRGKGIASELKRRAIRFAQRSGFRTMTAGNDLANDAIWSINERLGFRPYQVLLFGERTLDLS